MPKSGILASANRHFPASKGPEISKTLARWPKVPEPRAASWRWRPCAAFHCESTPPHFPPSLQRGLSLAAYVQRPSEAGQKRMKNLVAPPESRGTPIYELN